MKAQKISFPKTNGPDLAGYLEVPVSQKPHTYALFAHCFTCGKDLEAARLISRALCQRGFAVFRFDFTGIGESAGEGADATFSANIEDLVSAGSFLADRYQAPGLLVGHSFGGAAALCAAPELPSVRAVATIGAPVESRRLGHLLEPEGPSEEGKARIKVGGKAFTVNNQLLEDIRQAALPENLHALGRALLILHSPQDKVISIDHAARLYQAARHPKSYLSLDGADHLLSDREDAAYAGEMIASWAARYIDLPEKEMISRKREVAVRLGREGFTTDIMMRHHSLTADEPPEVGGSDLGPSPYELLSASLGACTAMTLQMYARRKQWPLEEVTVHLAHYKDYAEDARDCEKEKSKIDHFDRLIELQGPLDEKQEARLLEIANKCPVHRTLTDDIQVNTKLTDS